MINEDRILAEFLELVRIDSVSGQERQLADFLKLRLGELGLEVYEDSAGSEVGANSGNIIATLPATDDSMQCLFLCAHMDTVEPGRGVKPVVSDGIVRSSGDTILGADDKAGIAAIMEALRIIKENSIPHGGLEIVFTIWEEGGLLGAKNFDCRNLRSRYGYVLDSDGPPGTVIVQAPSQDRIGATVHGKAAHAGINPETGINAIQVASHAIAGMKLGRLDDETTANIGLISGGKAINIVPDAVSISGEVRSLKKEKRLVHTRSICEILQDTAERFNTRVDIFTQTLYHDFQLKPEDPPVKLAVLAAGKLGLESRLDRTGGGSDANVFNHKGLCVANLGIAMQRVHTTEEYIRIADLVSNARLLVEIISLNR